MSFLKHKWKLLALPNIIFLGLFFILPMTLILTYSVYTYDPSLIFIKEFTGENYVKILTHPLYTKAIFNTFQLAIIVSFAVLIIAYPVAYYLSQIKSKTEDTIITFILLAPILISIVTTSIAWVILLSPFGTVYKILNALNLLEGPLRIMFSKTGIIIGLTYGFIPYMVITLRSALSNIDLSLLRAAEILGASPAQAFYKVTFPLSVPGILSGFIVTFSLGISSFVTPFLLGSRVIKVMPILIYDNMLVSHNWPLGSASAVLLFISTSLFLGICGYIVEKRFSGWYKI
ncbi:ABC transporter permease [Thermoproteota archaeon]